MLSLKGIDRCLFDNWLYTIRCIVRGADIQDYEPVGSYILLYGQRCVRVISYSVGAISYM